MRSFAKLLDRLSYAPSRNGKLTLLQNYFTATPDPDRGYALAALTDEIPVTIPLRRILTELSQSRFDPVLFEMSRDYVGDSAETLSLIWPDNVLADDAPHLHQIIDTLKTTPRNQISTQLATWLDALDVTERWALLKFLSGALRVGVSARLAKLSLAGAFNRKIEDIEELWHGIEPPYTELFDWLQSKAARPDINQVPVFRPLMLAHPLDDANWQALKIEEFAVEWKWDGIRVQFVGQGGRTGLFSRTGDNIAAAFPELVENQQFEAVLDGELLVKRGDDIAPFADLQQRLNRKTVKANMLQDNPAHVRLYDALIIEGEDLRALPFDQRRDRLQKWHAVNQLHHTDLSPLILLSNKGQLQSLWAATRENGIEGLMLKLRVSPYISGRPKGKWYKWKRAALSADCVLMYAQRGSGKRSSYFSDYTFGVWTEDGPERKLVPVGKAYSGFSDEELQRIDKFVRNNTVERFGPVRSVLPQLVLEVSFDAINRSSRHKSGIAMRFPRITNIRWDKPASEADTLSTLMKLV